MNKQTFTFAFDALEKPPFNEWFRALLLRKGITMTAFAAKARTSPQGIYAAAKRPLCSPRMAKMIQEHLKTRVPSRLVRDPAENLRKSRKKARKSRKERDS